MMSKILEIDACRECPYLSTDLARNRWRCSQENRSILYMPNTEIPDWCPLPNAVEKAK